MYRRNIKNHSIIRKGLKAILLILILDYSASLFFKDYQPLVMKWYESTIPSNNNNQEEQIILNENNGTIKKDGTITIDDENNRDYIYEDTTDDNDFSQNNTQTNSSNVNETVPPQPPEEEPIQSDITPDNQPYQDVSIKDYENLYIDDDFNIINADATRSASSHSGSIKGEDINSQRIKNAFLTINKNDPKIYDATGKEVILKGVVLPNVDTIQFGAAVNETTLKSLRDNLGVNMIRFTLSPNSDIEWGKAFYRIKTTITTATELGIYVIINWGIMKSTEGDPRTTLDSNNYQGVTTANNFFKSIAEYSKNNPYVLFELCNEPYVKNGDSKYENLNTWNAVKEYSDVIIPIIREYSDNIIIVAGKSGVILNEIVNDPITKYSNIAYTFHMYPYNYKFATYKSQLEAMIAKNLTIIATETSIMNAALTEKNITQYDKAKMDEYLNFFKSKNYNLSFAYFKYDFPFESGTNSAYSEWSILKPIHKKYYDTRCTWLSNKNTAPCLSSSLYVRHFSNNDLRKTLSNEYFCASDENHCNKDIQGKGVFSTSGVYFLEKFMNLQI